VCEPASSSKSIEEDVALLPVQLIEWEGGYSIATGLRVGLSLRLALGITRGASLDNVYVKM